MSAAVAAATKNAAKNECAAEQFAEGWECERCALAWDDGDRPPPCLALTFTRMRLAAIEESNASNPPSARWSRTRRRRRRFASIAISRSSSGRWSYARSRV